jgi:hypothetical protein
LIQAGYKKDSLINTFEQIWLSVDIRAEDLSIQEWDALADTILL